MGTPLGTDVRLSSLFDNTESLIEIFVQIFTENYNEGQLTIGSNIVEDFKDKEVYYRITDSEFENVFLTFIYKNTSDCSPYEIKLETFNTDYPTELRIKVDSDITDKLPEQMIDDLYDKMHDFDID